MAQGSVDKNVTMASTRIRVISKPETTSPSVHPVVIIGQLKNLKKLSYNDVRHRLEPEVQEAVFWTGLANLHPSPTDVCSLYVHFATIAALPSNCSRHNTPSQAHSITKIVRGASVGVSETVLIICERADIYASACAVARAYPCFTRKTSPPKSQPVEVTLEFLIVNENAGEKRPPFVTLSKEEAESLHSSIDAIRLAARIVDTPCSEMNVNHFLKEIERVGEEVGASLKVIQGSELQGRGFGGVWGVGKAASVGPALAILSHHNRKAERTVAWVGKGIVYDTGGLSIKGRTAMPGMKRDCGGAAAILGAFSAAVSLGFNENLHAIFCLAENSVSSEATRPDDIHYLYSGRTVEINNTDAEGRLVLSDGVAYARKDLKADIILDMATLTSAQGVSTGKYHGAIMTNCEEWEKAGVAAGRASGDLLFPIVYCPELHFSEYTSVVADMKNSVADRTNALCSCAGLFVGANLGFDFRGIWIHIDMASPAYCGERATGYGVALLVTLFGQFSKDPCIRMLAPKCTASSVASDQVEDGP
ncbi:probable aminopeptidase NPEPL1 [Ischnura elegans]|uniref:probable aminopeptidase NPEPL1 n=1 Tax=Ischnura elegans TaxID=197161 RepID=UPI001ED8BF3C|nr:probable aminopeptidase NPEPL1 [Ischnura elegans]